MELARPLFIPVILGTARKGRLSEFAAQVVYSELAKRPRVETEVIDIRSLTLPTDDAGEAIKDSEFSSKMNRADALAIVSPEYNHGYSGLLPRINKFIQELIWMASTLRYGRENIPLAG